jgi:hypothetical protein
LKIILQPANISTHSVLIYNSHLAIQRLFVSFRETELKKQSLIPLLAAIVFSLAGTFTGSYASKTESVSSESEKVLWKLEHSYWRLVEENNLKGYRNLWHADFLGWPSVSPAPVRKDHITDWITTQTGKGFSFKLKEFKTATVQVTGKLGVICYWVTYRWADKADKGETYTIRVTHTWVKDGTDWRIIGGMSMPEPANAKQ